MAPNIHTSSFQECKARLERRDLYELTQKQYLELSGRFERLENKCQQAEDKCQQLRDKMQESDGEMVELKLQIKRMQELVAKLQSQADDALINTQLSIAQDNDMGLVPASSLASRSDKQVQGHHHCTVGRGAGSDGSVGVVTSSPDTIFDHSHLLDPTHRDDDQNDNESDDYADNLPRSTSLNVSTATNVDHAAKDQQSYRTWASEQALANDSDDEDDSLDAGVTKRRGDVGKSIGSINEQTRLSIRAYTHRPGVDSSRASTHIPGNASQLRVGRVEPNDVDSYMKSRGAHVSSSKPRTMDPFVKKAINGREPHSDRRESEAVGSVKENSSTNGQQMPSTRRLGKETGKQFHFFDLQHDHAKYEPHQSAKRSQTESTDRNSSERPPKQSRVQDMPDIAGRRLVTSSTATKVPLGYANSAKTKAPPRKSARKNNIKLPNLEQGDDDFATYYRLTDQKFADMSDKSKDAHHEFVNAFLDGIKKTRDRDVALEILQSLEESRIVEPDDRIWITCKWSSVQEAMIVAKLMELVATEA